VKEKDGKLKQGIGQFSAGLCGKMVDRKREKRKGWGKIR
jgi:hypothetical protein